MEKTLCRARYRQMGRKARNLLDDRWAPHYGWVCRWLNTVGMKIMSGAMVAPTLLAFTMSSSSGRPRFETVPLSLRHHAFVVVSAT